MIPITPLGPPPGFAIKVIRPAKAWVTRKAWDWNAPPPAGKSNELPDHWTKVLNELHEGYGGACAYLSVYTHRSLDSTSVDHFEPKSKSPIKRAYDWSNYRLASRPMNTNKGEHLDVLDPFALPPGLFKLSLVCGRVRVSDTVAPVGSALRTQAIGTLKRLKLNGGEYRDLRLHYIDEYLRNRQDPNPGAVSAARNQLLVQSPFIHHEVIRQGW
ncbi:MAG TPA: hypothetical protein VLI72_02870 [Methylibium sp.]|nr:hypothetical protein [Methylibium sp.]